MQTRGLSGSTLKLIAIITMLIDHVGAAILARFILMGNYTEALYKAYLTMRNIGRIAFPIFCFLLIEGFVHTRDRKKYALRLLTFALVSEIPFDLAFSSKLLEFEHQNVFFTLFIGLVTIMAIQYVQQREDWLPILRGVLAALSAGAGIGLAYLMKTDYDAMGVICILTLYLFYNTRGTQILAGCVVFGSFELPALVAFIPIAFYNGMRGWNIKYFFYVFYPAHLLIIYGICYYMGIAGISAI